MLLLSGFCVAEVFANHPDGDDGVDTEEEYALPTIHESDEMGETNIFTIISLAFTGLVVCFNCPCEE